MNKYLKSLHYLFNLLWDIFDNKPPVSYTINHQESRMSQQLYYFSRDDHQGICDLSLYI